MFVEKPWELGEHIVGLVRDLRPRPDQENDRHQPFQQDPAWPSPVLPLCQLVKLIEEVRKRPLLHLDGRRGTEKKAEQQVLKFLGQPHLPGS